MTQSRPTGDVLRQAHAASLAGILNQIACVAEYSLEIFRELRDESALLDEHMTRVRTRVNAIAELSGATSDGSQRLGGKRAVARLPSREESDRVLRIPEISFDHGERHPAVVRAYDRCEAMPALERLDPFCEPAQLKAGEDQLASSQPRKKYSHPGFFLDEWMKSEASRQRRALQAKHARRQERNDDRRERSASLSSQQQQQTQAASHLQPTPHESEASTTNNATGSDFEPRVASSSVGGVNKYLKIRSWREIYGTGEGKELARQPQQKENAALAAASGVLSVLGAKKKSSRNATDGSSTAARTAPDAPNHLQHSSLDYVTCPPPPPPPPPPPVGTCSGAFMQEIDGDDEIFDELDGASFQPELRGSIGTAAEFIDYGLSYYHDPAMSLAALPSPPPPPPLPPVRDDADSEGEYEPALSELPMDDDSGGEKASLSAPPPPPPPLLPLPPAPGFEAAVYLEIAERQHSRTCFLREIHAMSYVAESVMAPMPMMRAQVSDPEPQLGGGLVGMNNGLSASLPVWNGGGAAAASEYTPSSPAIPPVSKLDIDGDGFVTPDEWSEYTHKLLSSATSVVDRLNDPHAKSLMNDIVNFHYANLNDCIQRNVGAGWAPEGLGAKCNVKFRYSLLAGPTPFEWIARKQPEVLSDQVSQWFDMQFKLAVKDVETGRVRAGMSNAIPLIKTRLECLDKLLVARGTAPIKRSDYYDLVEEVHTCANSSP
ncbi:hypothetical protein PybrP1_004314 [[Pythium] brassicae (nom. inval.)]|nr:hypothetical protein PybrP1_004314 [[Pythium] brassicae (nom. inval.)]